ncbi:hypothetical protein ZHAS_00007502 [Anopheles sinensis]|uniref:Uncharacterized protein n=1 Tax=Anopheles sinensis TaxID=74873 RepID=A0A084VPZ9_ANOSI|nr:hypothetical protein ZHAS_00007502 [Anopheles sinensis]
MCKQRQRIVITHRVRVLRKPITPENVAHSDDRTSNIPPFAQISLAWGGCGGCGAVHFVT